MLISYILIIFALSEGGDFPSDKKFVKLYFSVRRSASSKNTLRVRLDVLFVFVLPILRLPLLEFRKYKSRGTVYSLFIYYSAVVFGGPILL